MIGPWTLIEKVVCWEIWQADMMRVVLRIDKPHRLDEQARVAEEAKLIANAPDMERLLGKLVTVVKGDALLMYDHQVGQLVDDAERLLGTAKLEPADGR